MSDLTYTLGNLNQLSEEKAAIAFANCCTASEWIKQMVAARPFLTKAQCHEIALEVWRGLEKTDYLAAFEGHPKIGDVSSLKLRYAHTKKLASGEQSSVNEAGDDVLQALADGNAEYEQKNGFIFIVCAMGKSAAEMLELLRSRLLNDQQTELKNAALEQAKITAIRIDKLLP